MLRFFSCCSSDSLSRIQQLGFICLFVCLFVYLFSTFHVLGSAGQQLFVYIQTIQSYLAPPITMTFTLGILWTGLTAAGALSGLLIGFLLGMMKFIFGNIYSAPECGEEDTRPGYVKMHFMYYGKLEICVYKVNSKVFSKKLGSDHMKICNLT